MTEAEPIEPDITINEVKLSVAQAMTVRVALGSFALSLGPEDALGDDKHGRAMRDGYLGTLRDILWLIHEG
jgi:hypothetical protein